MPMVQIPAALLGVVFAWSAAAKLLHHQEWLAALARFRLPPVMERSARVVVPVVEFLVPVLFVAGSVRAGAALVVALVAAFSVVILRARRLEGDRLPCGCFGKSKVRDYRLMLMRNSMLGVVAGILLLQGEDVAMFSGLGAPRGSEIVPVALVIVGLSAAAWALWVASSLFRKGQS
ncbi:MAG: MauE/DoxX family redox-associated membrane protein [Actinomycetota bacterium]